MKPIDWHTRLRAIFQRDRQVHPPKKESRLPLYNVTAKRYGEKVVVGFRLTLIEAEMLEKVVKRHMRRQRVIDDNGTPYFELTQTDIERVIS